MLIFAPRFVAAIRAGRKRQTIRAERARPIRPGDLLSLRRWDGHPYRSRQVEILGAPVRCAAAVPIALATSPEHGLQIVLDAGPVDPEGLDEFARRDGFADAREMAAWWGGRDGSVEFVGTLIRWGEEGDPCLR